MGAAFATATATCLTAAWPVIAADRPLLADPAPVVALHGAALDMSRAQVRAALAPGNAVGRACDPEGNPRLFLFECGPYRTTAVFTGAGRAWHIRASVDLSAFPQPADTLQALLRARYGEATATFTDHDTTLVWLPAQGTRPMAERCLSKSRLTAALLEPPSRNGPLPHRSSGPTPGCYPLRFAILTRLTPLTSRGLIVDVMDPAQRIAELPWSSAP